MIAKQKLEVGEKVIDFFRKVFHHNKSQDKNNKLTHRYLHFIIFVYFQQAIRNECVQVIVRCRPMSNKEKAGAFQQVVEVYPARGVIEILNPSEREATRENKKTFTYDAVYNANSTQQSIYDEVIRPLVSSVLEGFNGCVFGMNENNHQ